MKDNFSVGANNYAQFRPGYPEALISFLLEHCADTDKALDAGTGNGQLAATLSSHFKNVFATDISAEQLKNAFTAENITYKNLPAEQTDFPDKYFDLIAVAQAIHWFQFNDFYKEVNRTLKDDGLFAVVGYALLQVNAKIDTVILHFYNDVVGRFWDRERRYVDELYQTIPFPFNEIPAPELSIQYEWTYDQLVGYLYTWSAVKHFQKQEGRDPIELISEKLKEAWGDAARRTVTFPTLIRAGKKL